MFNSSARREAIEGLDMSVKNHETVRKQVERASMGLLEQRQRAAAEVIKPVEEYINLLANSPQRVRQNGCSIPN